jgi:hypothetical protein
LEEHLGHSLHWAVCQLHANELPLRHLFTELDGSTSGPRQFTGAIGKALTELNCDNLPVVDFHRIESEEVNISNEYMRDLSTDQKYLLQMHNAVRMGHCDGILAVKKTGKMAHSRWLTTASRALRLYVSTEDPSENCYR